MNYTLVIASTTILFLLIILALALKTKISTKITQGIVVVAVIGGLFYYGYGYAEVCEDISMAIIKATLAVCGMFVGKNDWSAISSTALFQGLFAQVFFWILHLMALFSTASAAIATIGASALRELRLWMIRKGKLVLIYGVNNDSLTLGRELNSRKDNSVLFVEDHPDSSIVSSIEGMGCIVRSDSEALGVTKAFLKNIGILGLFSKNRSITVYAVAKDHTKNVAFANTCIAQFEAAGIKTSQTRLVMQCPDENVGETMIALYDGEAEKPSTYGFGSVYTFSEEDLVARLLVNQYPPCNYVRFDNDAHAISDFDAVIVGFGLVGQAVLKQLVMNGQFPGSKFHVAVVAPDCEKVSGYIKTTSPELFNQYDIELLPIDARSAEFYTYMAAHARTLNYIAICTGSEKQNSELATRFLKYQKSIYCHASIFQCNYNGIKYVKPNDIGSVQWNLYNKALLEPEKRDHLAMLLNDYYEGNPLTSPETSWARCSYFNKLSSIASTDAIPSYLKMLSLTKETALRDGIHMSEEQLETLAKAEHLRWNAFHYVMGYRLMTEAELQNRLETFKRIEAEEGIDKARKYKISKDSELRLHTCLVDWEELDAVTEREKAVTKKESLNYKQADRNNIILMETLLKAEEKLSR